MTMAEIEKALNIARTKVFDDDDAVSDAAQAEVARLKAMLLNHPDYQRREDDLRQARDERQLFLWD